MCSGPLVLTTSKKLKGVGGFPELQIPRSQKHRFQLTILPGICGVSSLVFFQRSLLQVVIIPGNFDQVTYANFAILNITLGIMQKYIAFYAAKPEFAKYVGNMNEFCRDAQFSLFLQVWSITPSRTRWEFSEARSRYNFPQKCDFF